MVSQLTRREHPWKWFDKCSQDMHSQRYFYVVRCVFVWNPGTDRCWLEAYSPLVDVTKHVNHVNTNWAPAKGEAARLRKALRYSTLFMLPSYPPIRTLSHHMWSSNQILGSFLNPLRIVKTARARALEYELIRITTQHPQCLHAYLPA
ncbi:protein modification by small protein conjugation [Homalodisca vitripennis]|nr:protein modification by small protein conjugation [Homalodisca vitripennis]